jgi:hypothetical protein
MKYKNISYEKIRVFNGNETIIINPNEDFESDVTIDNSNFKIIEEKIVKKQKKEYE